MRQRRAPERTGVTTALESSSGGAGANEYPDRARRETSTRPALFANQGDVGPEPRHSKNGAHAAAARHSSQAGFPSRIHPRRQTRHRGRFATRLATPISGTRTARPDSRTPLGASFSATPTPGPHAAVAPRSKLARRPPTSSPTSSTPVPTRAHADPRSADEMGSARQGARRHQNMPAQRLTALPGCASSSTTKRLQSKCSHTESSVPALMRSVPSEYSMNRPSTECGARFNVIT